MKIRELIEALATRKKIEKGQVPFRKSTLADQHIIAAITDLSQRTGVPTIDIIPEVEEKIKQYEIIQQYSPKLYDTIVINAAENAVFNHIQDSRKLEKLDLSDVKFEPRVFNQLINLIQQENSSFLPIKPKGEFKPLYRIVPIIVPSKLPKYQPFNDIPTAAATPKGEFIFNKTFMQDLIYYATSIGLKPQGKKYQSNGGPIPDNYAFLEFLIMHELLHYRFGDHITSSKYKKYSHMAKNWAMDFRINYILVKNGYEQLPMGLFSDDLNFDRSETKNFRLLMKAVQEELDKLPGSLADFIDAEFATDEHDSSEGGNKTPPPKIKPPEVFPGDIVVQKTGGYPQKVLFVRVKEVYDDGTADVEEVSAEVRDEIIRKLKEVGKLK